MYGGLYVYIKAFIFVFSNGDFRICLQGCIHVFLPGDIWASGSDYLLCVFETIQMNVSLCNQGEHRCARFCVNILGLCYGMCGFVAACVCFTDV